MYKSILWIMGFLCLVQIANAQLYFPEVFGSAGASGSGTSHDSWTLGEPIVLTLDNGTLVLTQGFHQPDLPIVGVAEPHELSSPFVYPNPSAGRVFLDLAGLGKGGGSLRVMDAHGRLVKNETLARSNSEPLELDLSELSNGMYFLWLRVNDTPQPFVFKLEKIGFTN